MNSNGSNALPPKETPFFRVHREEAVMFDHLPEKEAGQLIKSEAAYFLYGEQKQFADPLMDAIARQSYASVDRSISDYEKRRANGQNGGHLSALMRAAGKNTESTLENTKGSLSILDHTKPPEPILSETIRTDPIQSEQSGNRTVPAQTNHVVPPSISEVKDYCLEANLRWVRPEIFFDYYAGKGWLVGNTPMRDWRAKCREWNERETAKNFGKEPPPSLRLRNADYEALEINLDDPEVCRHILSKPREPDR